MQVKPLADRILVKRSDCKETISHGIIIPESIQETPQEGQVIAVGPGKLNEKGNLVPISVKIGDTILMGKYAGTEVKINDVEHLILREDDVLAIIE